MDLAAYCGPILKRLRERTGMMQKEVAEKLGVPTQRITHYETGHSRPPLASLDALLEVLGATLHDVAELYDEIAAGHGERRQRIRRRQVVLQIPLEIGEHPEDISARDFNDIALAALDLAQELAERDKR